MILKTIAIFLADNFLKIHAGAAIMVKIKAAAKIAVAVSPIAYILEKIDVWTMLNKDFLFAVCVAIAIDHLIGSIYHGFKKRDFTFKKNLIGLLTKLSLCMVAGILFEIMGSLVKGQQFIFDYLQIVTRLIVFLYPAGSAFMNMSALTNGTFPPIGWIKKIKGFNEDLDLNKFKDNCEPNQQHNDQPPTDYDNNERVN